MTSAPRISSGSPSVPGGDGGAAADPAAAGDAAGRAAEQAAAVDARIAGLEARLGSVENAARRAEGSAGRTDALVVAFATRRAIDRGVSLGYLETLLVDRFGARHPQAVATIVTASRVAGPARRADRRL